MEIKQLFNLEETIAKDLLQKEKYPWECLPKISEFIIELGEKLNKEKFEQKAVNIWVAKSAKIAPTASIIGPAIIDENAEIRHCAFIRGNVIVGKNAVVGNSTELKNSILFNEVEVPHFNYVGDSILGYKAHMGAGSITSNVKADKTNVVIRNILEKKEQQKNKIIIETNLRKVGAFLGDEVQIGCNTVLNPGTIIEKNASVYPLSCVRGIIPENCIYKNSTEIIRKMSSPDDTFFARVNIKKK